MGPAIRQRFRIERLRDAADFIELKQPRTFRNQQPDRELDRRDVIDEIETLDEIQKLAVSLERRPRMKRDEGRHEDHARAAAQRNRLEEIPLRVSFLEKRQHTI